MLTVKTLSKLPKTALEYLKKSIKSVHFYLTIAAFICMIIGLALYLSIDGTSAYLKEISSTAVALYVMGIVVSFIVLFTPFKMAYVLAFCLTFSAPLLFLASQGSFIVNVLTAIDGQSFSMSFILGAVFPLISTVLLIVSCVLIKEPALFDEKSKKVEAKEESNSTKEGV